MVRLKSEPTYYESPAESGRHILTKQNRASVGPAKAGLHIRICMFSRGVRLQPDLLHLTYFKS